MFSDMSSKSRRTSIDFSSQSKKKRTQETSSYFYKLFEDSGLTIKHPPEKCISTEETIYLIRNVKKNLQKHFNYPRNITELFADFETECKDINKFKHYLFPNIVRISNDSQEEHLSVDSVVKILLNIPMLQNKLLDYIFEKAIDLAAESKCGPWIQMILKCCSSLDSIVNTDKVSSHLINLLDISSEKMVRLEIITAIPDIIGDQEHDNIANEMSRILSEDHDLIPAILDCLSYLCLSDEQNTLLRKKTLNILMSLTKCYYFPNFIKFLLMSGSMNDTAYLESVQGLRNSLGWSSSMSKSQDIATSQVLTATAIRNSIVSSKIIGNTWFKVLSSCKASIDCKPIDFILLLILFSTNEERQRQVENLIKKQIKLDVFKEDLLNETFAKFKPILKENLKHLIDLTNSLLQTKSDPLIESFASHIYTLMFAELSDCCQTVVAELLQLGLDRKQCVTSILQILNNIAEKNISILKPQSLQMLTLLDRMDDMSLHEIKAVMNLLCGLAYSFENSVIRDDIHMIIRKELSSSSPIIKIQGILAGVHAVKYLMTTNDEENNSVDLPDNISFSTNAHLSEGDIREAAQIIELISRSTRQFPAMIAFFYDELTEIITSSTFINKNFLSWLTDAVTNDLQQNFIVDSIEVERVCELKLSMQYCLNAESEMDEVIAINIGGLTLQAKDEVPIAILSPLFQLVQTLHSKQSDGCLSSIDALLGCPVVMPKFDTDLVEDMDHATICNILNCLIHCINWFRELLNAFASQKDYALKKKILHRILLIEEIESLVSLILVKTKILYTPPICSLNIGKYTGDEADKKAVKASSSKQKNAKPDETALPETVKSQTQQNLSMKSKLDILSNIPLRPLNLTLLQLFNTDIADDDEEDTSLIFKTLNFILKCVNGNLEGILISKIKKNTFLSKQSSTKTYDPKKAEICAKAVGEILPHLMKSLKDAISYLEKHMTENSHENSLLYTTEIITYASIIENIYNTCSIFFKWIGFRNHHTALLKSSLRTIASLENSSNLMSLKDLTVAVANYLQKQEKYCLQFSTAVALVEFLKSIQDYSENLSVLKVLKSMTCNFLNQQWKSLDGAPEKGIIFNQGIDRFASLYLVNVEIIALKNLTLQLTIDIQMLKNKNDTLVSMKSIGKSNFAILYRNLGTSLYEATKNKLTKGMTNSEHLELWRDVATILKNMSEITKTLETRNNLSAFFKKSLPIIKLFISQGIPILEMQFKNNTEGVLEILKILQQSTRFLQSLCCHSRLKKDTALMSKVPYMRQLLETLLYKVKAALAANNCTEAFWMGNLKNKNIHGEVIATQQSVESEESVEDCDDQLPEDDSDASDEDMLNPDSKSLSDIV